VTGLGPEPSQNRSTPLPAQFWANGPTAAKPRPALPSPPPSRAFDASPWSWDRSLRLRALNEIADRFDAHAEELGTLVTKENGKKIAEGTLEGTSPGPTLRHAAAQALFDTGVSAEVSPPDVQVVSYIGSTPGGRLVAACGCATLKRMNLELRRQDADDRVQLRATDGALAAAAFYRPTLLELEDVTTEIVQKESPDRPRRSRSSTPRPTRSPTPTPPNTPSRLASSPTTSTSAAGSAARSTPAPSGPPPGRRSTMASATWTVHKETGAEPLQV
jgi:hypothetical protein